MNENSMYMNIKHIMREPQSKHAWIARFHFSKRWQYHAIALLKLIQKIMVLLLLKREKNQYYNR